MTEQETVERSPMDLGVETVPVEALNLNDVVREFGLIVKIEDGEQGRKIGFGSTRAGKPHVEQTKTFKPETKVDRLTA